jgi:hypothetical protein
MRKRNVILAAAGCVLLSSPAWADDWGVSVRYGHQPAYYSQCDSPRVVYSTGYPRQSSYYYGHQSYPSHQVRSYSYGGYGGYRNHGYSRSYSGSYGRHSYSRHSYPQRSYSRGSSCGTRYYRR